MTISEGKASESVFVQTEPVLSTKSNGPDLLRRIESRAYEAWAYSIGTPLTVLTLPLAGILVVNGVSTRVPVTIREGDSVAWFPGEVC